MSFCYNLVAVIVVILIVSCQKSKTVVYNGTDFNRKICSSIIKTCHVRPLDKIEDGDLNCLYNFKEFGVYRFGNFGTTNNQNYLLFKHRDEVVIPYENDNLRENLYAFIEFLEELRVVGGNDLPKKEAEEIRFKIEMTVAANQKLKLEE